MTGYEKSPDYGDPPAGGEWRVLIALAGLVLAGILFWMAI